MRIVGTICFLLGCIAVIFGGMGLLVGIVASGHPRGGRVFLGGIILLAIGFGLMKIAYVIGQRLDPPTEIEKRETRTWKEMMF